MAGVPRTSPTIQGKEKNFFVKKPGGNTLTMIGCLTNYDFNEPGFTSRKIECRAGTENARSGSKELATVEVSGIQKMHPTAQQAANVVGEEVRKWVQEGTILEAAWGGKGIVGDAVHSGKGFFNNFREANPNETESTWQATWNCMEEYTTAAETE